MQPGTGGRITEGLGLAGTVWNPTSQTQELRLVRDDDMVSPSDMIAMGDTFLDGGDPNVFGYDKVYAPDARYLMALAGVSVAQPLQQLMDIMNKRHAGRWNLVFCDGHTGAPKTRELFDYRSDQALERWHRDHLPHRETLPGDLP